MKAKSLLKYLAVSILALSSALALVEDSSTVPPSEVTPVSQEGALAQWEKIYEVFSHPRCANCHVPDDQPRWSGPSYGPEPKVHGMNIHAGASRIGAETILCSTCHMQTNSPTPHGPPGSPVWLLAPLEMTWWEKSSQEICEQIKDPARNGGRTIEEVAAHVDHDALVHWGWEPGPGREPAPYSAKEVAQFLLSWEASGAPCPE